MVGTNLNANASNAIYSIYLLEIGKKLAAISAATIKTTLKRSMEKSTKVIAYVATKD